MFKKLLQVIFSKFARKYNKDIKKAQKWLDSAQAQFASAIEEAGLAEKQFEKALEEKRATLQSVADEISELHSSKAKAVKFKAKIESFLD